MFYRNRQDAFYADRIVELIKNEMAVAGLDLAAASRQYLEKTAAPRRVQIMAMKKLNLI